MQYFTKVRVSIHQPDMLPWPGFFAKLMQSDKWIVLDHTCNNPRSADFLCRRVQYLDRVPTWLSLPLDKGSARGRLGIPIYEIEFQQESVMLKERRLKRFYFSYKKHEYFKSIFPIVESYMLSDERNLLRRNLRAISELLSLLDIDIDIVLSSTLGSTHSSTNMLVELIELSGGSVYISGEGGKRYQDEGLFSEHGIGLRYSAFEQKAYRQRNSLQFWAGLSTIDMMMNIGLVNTKAYLKESIMSL